MSPEERVRAVDALPGEVTFDEMSPPEGEHHSLAKIETLDVLRRFFGNEGKGLYVAIELPTYYPDTRRFAPDVLAVRDVDRHIRDKWVVSVEGKGLDFVLEVHYGGDRKKDTEHNVTFYASIGIPEYFIYDRRRQRLQGYRLGGIEARTYQPILGQHGFVRSEVLGLDIVIKDQRLRFFMNNAPLLDSTEWIAQIEGIAQQRELEAATEAARANAEAQRATAEAERATAEAERATAEAERATAEAVRAKGLEEQLAAAMAEIERLKKRP